MNVIGENGGLGSLVVAIELWQVVYLDVIFDAIAQTGSWYVSDDTADIPVVTYIRCPAGR